MDPPPWGLVPRLYFGAPLSWRVKALPGAIVFAAAVLMFSNQGTFPPFPEQLSTLGSFSLFPHSVFLACE